MSCLYPRLIRVQPGNRLVTVSCRKCHNCRIERQSVLEFGCLMALLQGYKYGTGASFLTLTYSNKYLPLVAYDGKAYATLRKSDYNLWWSKVRKHFRDNGLYVPQMCGCGEYGSDEERPHYHALVFGANANYLAKVATDAWKTKGDLRGIIQCKPLRSGGIRYVIDYIMKEDDTAFKSAYDDKGLERPFLRRSTRLGLEFFWKDFDYDPADFTYLTNGKRKVIPSDYRKRLPGGAQFQYENVQAIENAYEEGVPLDLYNLRESFKNAELDVLKRRQKGNPVAELPSLTDYITSGYGAFERKKIEKQKCLEQFKKVGLPIEKSYYTPERLDLLDNETRKYIISQLKYLD